MRAAVSIEDRIAARYIGLSSKLKEAADYVAGNPVGVTTRSLCSISNSSGISSAIFPRPIRASGPDGCAETRAPSHVSAGCRLVSSSEPAESLRIDPGQEVAAFRGQTAIRVDDVRAFEKPVDRTRSDAPAASVRERRDVMPCVPTGMAECVAYRAGRFASNWTLEGRVGASPGALLASAAAWDVLPTVTDVSCGRRAIPCSGTARRRQAGIGVIVVPDCRGRPAPADVTEGVVTQADSPRFFSSPLSPGEADVGKRIRGVERKNSGLERFRTPDDQWHQSKGKA